MRGTWQTTESRGSGGALAAAAVGLIGAAVALAVLGAVVHLIEVVAIILGVLIALGLAAWVAAAAPPGGVPAAQVSPARAVPWQRGERLSAPRREAVGAPREVHIHIHGGSAEDVAAIIARGQAAE